MKALAWLLTAAIIVGIVALVLFLIAWVFMIAWNSSVVPAFNWPIIEYWQAFWLIVVARILLPSVGGLNNWRSNG